MASGINNNYGTTWWGKKWLDSLTGIDLANRIPRGKSYAVNNKVKDVLINQNQILAKVSGHRRSPYRVCIELPKFTTQEKNDLMDAIIASPMTTCALANRELDPEIFNIAQKLGIQIFPESWRDLEMFCSCPDYAVPCKHIAAVIYICSIEIDTNPFILFSMKGLDLLGELQNRGINFTDAAEVKLPDIKQLFTSEPNSNGYFKYLQKSILPISNVLISPESVINNTSYSTNELLTELKELSFCKYETSSSRIISFLDDNPAGCMKGSIKTVMQNMYKKMAKQALTIFQTDAQLISESQDKSLILLKSWFTDSLILKEINEPVLFNGIINETELQKLPIQTEVLYRLWYIAIKLISNEAIIPELFTEKNEKVINTRWVPATISQTVREVVTRVGFILNNLPMKFFKVPNKNCVPNDLQMGINAISYFITKQVQNVYANNYGYSFDDQSELIKSLLFGHQISGKNTKNIFSLIPAIEKWLSPLSISSGDIKAVIIAEDRWIDEKLIPGKESDCLPEISLYFAKNGENEFSRENLTPIEDILNDRNFKDRFEYIKNLAKISAFCPFIKKLIAEKTTTLQVELNELKDLLVTHFPILELFGIKIILPKSMVKLLKPKPVLKLTKNRSSTESRESLIKIIDLIKFSWVMKIGGEDISEAQFEKMVSNVGKLVRFKNWFVYMDQEELAKIIKQRKLADKKIASKDLLQAALTGNYNGVQVVLDQKLKDAIQELVQTTNISVPKTINAELRPYQQRGFSWLVKNCQVGIGSILADDMGLGKTLQVISTIEYLRLQAEFKEKKALVVVPTTLLLNWQREISKFAPNIKYSVIYGINEDIDQKADVVITTYGKLRSKIELFNKLKLRLLVIDEAQAIKNRDTDIRKTICSLKPQSSIAMSGTPVENKLMEYWSLLDFSNLGLMGTAESFRKKFVLPIEREHDQIVLQSFKSLSAPFIMRRLKSDKNIISDLPDKLVSDEYCSLSAEQATLYKAVIQDMLPNLKNSDTAIKRSAIVLKLITALKQICNAPSCFIKQEASSVDTSGKGALLIELLEKLIDSGKKVIIFTQFRETGELLQKWINEKFSISAGFLHGQLTQKQRNQLTDDFQEKRNAKVLILSVKAAGTGLNLTAASAVIHYDLWWNPAVENQATDRVYRIGQKQNVNVYRLITAGTFEEKVNEIINNKRKLADLTVADGEKWIGNLNNKELEDLFKLSSE
ncbi:MAG: SNF2-related protein [Succinivibrionaceae bacterium]